MHDDDDDRREKEEDLRLEGALKEVAPPPIVGEEAADEMSTSSK